MGYICRHTIAVTGTYGDYIDRAHKFAKSTGAHVTPIFTAPVNSERTFFVVPDGSKEFWPESDKGNQQRKEIVEYLKLTAYEDGSSPLAWVEVAYGDDNGLVEIKNYSL